MKTKIRSFVHGHRIIALLIATVLALSMPITVLAITYSLNAVIPATLTVNEIPQQPTSVTLYEDLQCTTPITYAVDNKLNFGAVELSTPAVTKVVYFKSNKDPQGGAVTGEVNPATVQITNNINPAVATFLAVVGTPFGAEINGNHPCMITLSVMPVAPGTSDFDITVTGTD